MKKKPLGRGRPKIKHIRQALESILDVKDVAQRLKKIVNSTLDSGDMRAFAELAKIMGWYAPVEMQITNETFVLEIGQIDIRTSSTGELTPGASNYLEQPEVQESLALRSEIRQNDVGNSVNS